MHNLPRFPLSFEIGFSLPQEALLPRHFLPVRQAGVSPSRQIAGQALR